MNAPGWPPRSRLAALAVIGVLSGAAALDIKRPAEAPPAAPAPRPSSPSPADETQPLARVELERLEPRKEGAREADTQIGTHIFRSMTWRVEPPPPPPKPTPRPAPPPPPTAPPVPFTFMGRYEDGGARILMLVKEDRVYTVSEGDVIDSTYRVERLAGGSLELTYLPLGTRQSISAGGTP